MGVIDPLDVITRNLSPIRYEANKWGFPKGLDAFSLSDGSDKGTPRELADAVTATAANALAPGIYRGVSKAALPVAERAIGKVAGKIASSVAGEAAAGGVAGAAFDPEHPIASGMAGGALGVVLGEGGRQIGKGVALGAGAVKPGLRKIGAAASELPDAAKRYRDKWNTKPETKAPTDNQTPSTPALPEGAVSIRRMPVSEIIPDPERFQYKRGGDAETGAGSELKGLSQFDEMLGGVISVWRDETGVVRPVNGHNRLALAKRTGHESVNVQELPAKTAEEARAMGALANIAEGRGTALDAATFFRNSGLGIEDLKDRVSFRGVIAKNGLGLSKLAPDLFDSRSVEADLKLLSTMLNWATTVRVRGGRRLLEQNPLAGLRKPTEKNPRRPVATWERYEATRKAIQQLTEESKTDAERSKWLKLELAIVIAEATGRRLGSIRQLAWPDIDFTNDTIQWRADTDKKGKSWRVPMPPALRDEIKSFRVRLGSAFGSLVFPSDSDATVPVRTDVFSTWLRAAEKKAELSKLDGSLWHAYRRGWATSRKHLPTADVAAAGGWSDVTTLIRCYQQVDDDTLLRVMNEPRKVMERAKSG